jgi:translation elongation factor EF-Tu-like GTPase
MPFTIQNPELEAEIYYLTTAEGGRQSYVASGYRGRFHYNNYDWDAPQQSLDKEVCELGGSVKVLMKTTRPEFHIGKLYIGMEFEIREGLQVMWRGRITRVLRDDFLRK